MNLLNIHKIFLLILNSTLKYHPHLTDVILNLIGTFHISFRIPHLPTITDLFHLAITKFYLPGNINILNLLIVFLQVNNSHLQTIELSLLIQGITSVYLSGNVSALNLCKTFLLRCNHSLKHHNHLTSIFLMILHPPCQFPFQTMGMMTLKKLI